MGTTYKITCDRCRYRGDLDCVLRTYKFQDGSNGPISRAAAWCHQCQTVTWAERIPPLIAIEERIAAYQRRDQKVLDFLRETLPRNASLDDRIADSVSRYRQEAIWRSQRKSPPRCLECGSTEFIPLVRIDTGSETINNLLWTLSPHPGCGGELSMRINGFFVICDAWIHYTPEGERIPEVGMPPGVREA